MDKLNELLKSSKREVTDMEAVINMFGTETGIIIDDNIALIGMWDGSESSVIKKEAVYRKNSILSAGRTITARGDFFKVIDADGCILFDEFIEESGELIGIDGSIEGYIFILKDYKATQGMDVFLGEESPGVIIYSNNKLYINNVIDDKVRSKYIYNKSIYINTSSWSKYILSFDNKQYTSYVMDKSNRIHKFTRIGMKL